MLFIKDSTSVLVRLGKSKLAAYTVTRDGNGYYARARSDLISVLHTWETLWKYVCIW